jgi:hypothetical protein
MANSAAIKFGSDTILSVPSIIILVSVVVLLLGLVRLTVVL